MKKFNQLFSVFFTLILFSLFIVESTTAQRKSYESKKSQRDYYNAYEKSVSSKSSATETEYNNNKREKDYSDRYERNTKKDSDSYTRKEKNNRNYKNESSENYFHIDKSGNTLWDGKHWEESRFPLKIYVRESN